MRRRRLTCYGVESRSTKAARERQPSRWSGEIRDWTLAPAVWLNPEADVDRKSKQKAV
jgi:hypothetical protein